MALAPPRARWWLWWACVACSSAARRAAAVLHDARTSPIPPWPRPSAADEASHSELRERLLNAQMRRGVDVGKPEPTGYSLNLEHLGRCTSCFDDAYRASVHAPPLRCAPGAAQLLLDDHAVDGWRALVRTREAPSKAMTDIGCAEEESNCISKREKARNYYGFLKKHRWELKKSAPREWGGRVQYGGFYGSVLWDRARRVYRMWRSEFDPRYAESADGLHWGPATPLSEHTDHERVEFHPQNVCVMRDAADNEPEAGREHAHAGGGAAEGARGRGGRGGAGGGGGGGEGRGVKGAADAAARESGAPAAPPSRFLMGYHCGNWKFWESTCVAASDDGLRWEPLEFGEGAAAPRARVAGGVGSPVRKNSTCAELSQCCGAPCDAGADSSNCLYRAPGVLGGAPGGAAAERASARGGGAAGARPPLPLHLVKRRNFATSHKGWREIRGVSISAARPRASDARLPGTFSEVSTWYFDRRGKAERFQRQMYAFSVSALPAEGLYLGIANVLEWPKASRLLNTTHLGPPYPTDYSSIYLLPSRDGVHFELSSVYAYQRMVHRGGCSAEARAQPLRSELERAELEQRVCDFDHGFVQPASELVTGPDGREHLYYEGRPAQHEKRWRVPVHVARASWERHRWAAVRADPDDAAWGASARAGARCAQLRTKPFLLEGPALSLNARLVAEAAAAGAEGAPRGAGNARAATPTPPRLEAVLEILDGAAGPAPRGANASARGGEHATPPELRAHTLAHADGTRLVLRWEAAHGARGADLSALVGRRVALRFELCGPAKLFAFTVHAEVPPSGARALAVRAAALAVLLLLLGGAARWGARLPAVQRACASLPCCLGGGGGWMRDRPYAFSKLPRA